MSACGITCKCNYNTGIFLYLNDGAGGFSAVADPVLNERVNTHSGFASGDIDGDGDIDVAIGNWGDTHEGEFVTLLTNVSAACGRSVRLQLRNRYGAIDPIGARVTLVSRGHAGERRQVREVSAQSGWRSQSASAFLFGVPTGERLLRAEVRWPDGRTQTVTDLQINDLNRIDEIS